MYPTNHRAEEDIFFPVRGKHILRREAKKICSACTVSEECAEYALKTDSKDGVWGAQ